MPAEVVESKLNEGEGVFLTRPFSEEEIKEAIWDCEVRIARGRKASISNSLGTVGRL